MMNCEFGGSFISSSRWIQDCYGLSSRALAEPASPLTEEPSELTKTPPPQSTPASQLFSAAGTQPSPPRSADYFRSRAAETQTSRTPPPRDEVAEAVVAREQAEAELRVKNVELAAARAALARQAARPEPSSPPPSPWKARWSAAAAARQAEDPRDHSPSPRTRTLDAVWKSTSASAAP